MALLVGGLALAYGARKYHKHEQKKRNAAEYDYSDLSLRSALSMLVHDAYFRHRGHILGVSEWAGGELWEAALGALSTD